MNPLILLVIRLIFATLYVSYQIISFVLDLIDFELMLNLLFVGMTVYAAASFLWRELFPYHPGMSHQTRSEFSHRLHKCRRNVPVDFWKFRNYFRNHPFPQPDGCDGNPHRPQALARTQASWFINDMADHLGTNIYSESASKSDIRNGHSGTRLFYDVKDLEMEPEYHNTRPDHLVKMVDVDYYLDRTRIDELIATSAGVVMYTSQPQAVAEFGKSGHMLTGSDFTQWYEGGNTYDHQLWDWSRDIYVSYHRPTSSCWWGLLWLEWNYNVMTVCQVERRCSGDKMLVALIPRSRHVIHDVWDFGLADAAKTILSGNEPLKRLESTHRGEGIYTFEANGRVSMFQGGSNICYEMSTEQFNNCLCGAKAKNVSTAVLETILGKRNAYHAREMFLSMQGQGVDLRLWKAGDSVPRFYTPLFADRNYLDGRIAGVVTSPPVIDGAFIPRESAAADQAMLEKRIIKPRPEEKDHDFEKYLPEFKSFLRRLSDEAVPLSLLDLMECQNGKKKQEYERAADIEMVNLLWRSFQKAEAYPEVKDPRNISNVDKRHVVRYLCFTQVASKILSSKSKWYAFGNKPEDVAAMLNEVCSRSLTVCETDFTRFDGSLSQFLRHVEHECLEVFFKEEFHEELAELFNETLYQDIRTKYRLVYNNGSGRLSGSACTSVGNTIISAFTSFIALRESGLSADEAWRALGLYGGDDGVTAFPDPEVAEATMKSLGLGFKATLRAPGDTVGFLGRVYLDPWTHYRSHHDIKRAASKLHYCPSKVSGVTNEEMAWRKAVSIFATDSGTPIIGDWARQVLKVIPFGVWVSSWKDNVVGITPGAHTSQAIIEKFDGKPVYPGPIVEERASITRTFVDDSPISLNDYKTWLVKLSKAKNLGEFPPPLWTEQAVVKSDYPVLVDGAVLGPPMRKSETVHCLAWAAGKCNRGSSCKYEHDMSKSETARDCRYFAAGKCDNERCIYRHRKPCNAFQDGKCKRKKCRFAHIARASHSEAR